MPPPWLVRSTLLLAAVALLLLAGAVIWSDGWRSYSPWLLVALSANLLLSVLWIRPSKARDLFAKASFTVSLTMLAGSTLAVFSPQGSRVEEPTWLLLGAAWSILFGALLVRAAIWLRSRARPPLS